MPNSAISAELVRAYHATEFRVLTDIQYEVMCIGRRAVFIETLYAQAGVGSGVFITADNPFSHPATEAENAVGHQKLGELLRVRTPFVADGVGVADSGEWPAERGYFALGIDRDEAADWDGSSNRMQ